MISTAVGDEQQINLAILNADKQSPASSARSDCVHEQVAKLGPVSRAAGMDCECPLYKSELTQLP